MEVGNRAGDAQAQGGSSGSRHRRRRDRGEEQPHYGSNQAVGGYPHDRVGYESYPGERNAGFGMQSNGSGSTRYRQEAHNGYDHHGGGHWGGGEGRGNRGHRGGWNNHYMPPEPPWAAPEEESGLKDLLLQVAPQARIVENTSRLASKASANILSKVLSEAAHNTTSADYTLSEDWNGKLDHGASTSGASGSAHGNEKSSRPPPSSRHEDDDDEAAFAERWSGLFSKGSPLVEGSLQDPFEDVKKRTKVVWKKDRKGHRTRQQARKMQKEKEDGTYGEDDEEYADVVYDASATQWQPQRPPKWDGGSEPPPQWD